MLVTRVGASFAGSAVVLVGRAVALLSVVCFALAGPWGCSLFGAPPSTEGDDDPFVHRAYTSWAPIPSSDGRRLAFMLEPRRVDADSHGVMISGWRGRVAGDTLLRSAVGDDAGRVLMQLSGGFHFVDTDDATAYVFSSDASEWTPTAPNDPAPPPRTFVSVTWLARADLSVQGTTTLDPPLEWPYALGSSLLLDTPHDGASDIARDVRLTTFDVASRERRTLHEGRGFEAFSCARKNAVTVAYRPEGHPGTTTIVDVVLDSTTKLASAVKLDVEDLSVKSVRCRRDGAHFAVIGTARDAKTSRTVLVHDRGPELAIVREVAAGEPVALSTDGATLLATKSGGQAALFDAKGAVDLSGVIVSGTADVSGERALVNGKEDGFVVRLDATTPTSMRIAHGSKVEGERTAKAAGGGRFLVFDTTSGGPSDDYADHLVAAFIVEADGSTNDVTMDVGYGAPRLAYANGHVAHLIADRGKNPTAVDVVTVDLDAHAVTATARSMFCDQNAIRTKNRCLP